MVSATVDTNIYISALEYGCTPLMLLDSAVRSLGCWNWRRGFTASPCLVAPKQTLDVIKEDPDDNRILECAVEAGSAYIVSGDKDLHRLGQYGGAQVIKVADMLDVVQGKGWRSPRR